MKEKYEENKTMVKLSKEDISKKKNGSIIKGFRVDVGLEVDNEKSKGS